MSPNRIVASITPIAALAAGWAASWLADHVPGLTISEANLQAVFITGAVAVLAPALHWLHGWQKWETLNEESLAAAARGFPAEAPTVIADDGGAVEDFGADVSEDEDDFDELFDTDEFEDTSVADEEEPVAAGS